MNERVWLQAETGLVNKFLAFFAGFLVFLSAVSCSQENNTSPPDTHPLVKDEEVATINDAGPFVTVIWESEALEGPIAFLAAASQESATSYILAIRDNGASVLVDLDGVVVARGEFQTAAGVSNGYALEIDGEKLLAFPTLIHSHTDKTLVLTLASPTLGVMTQIPIETNGLLIDGLCVSSRSTPHLMMRTKENGVLVRQIVSEEDQIFLKDNGPNAESEEEVTETTSQSCDETGYLSAGNHLIGIQINSDGQIFAESRPTGGILKSMPITLRSGLSVSAPEFVSAFSLLDGRVSVDYPHGLIALAGLNAAGEHRISFVSAKDVAHLLGLTITPPSWEAPSSPRSLAD